MAGVVIIHAQEDAAPAHALAEKLGALGYRTATDLTSGALRETVEEADVVVALWSPRSAGRPDLVGEAAFARGLGRLVHARMHNAPVPREFAGDPQIDLTGWKGNDDFAGWLNLRAALEGVLSAAYPRKQQRPNAEPPARRGADFGESFSPPPQAPRPFSSYDAPGYDAARRDSQPRYDAARFDEPHYDDRSRYDSPRRDAPRPDESHFDQPRYDAPRSDPSRVDHPRYDAPRPDQARFDQPPYDAPRLDQPRFDQPRYDQSRFDQPRYDGPRPDQSRFDQPRYDAPGSDESRFERPRYDAPRPDPSRYDPPRYDQPSSGRSSTTRLAVIGLLTFVVVAGVGFGGYQMLRGGQNKAAAESAWAALDKEDPLALRAFIDGEPGRFRAPAESALEELEIAELNQAREADTVEAYRRFLAGFPDTRHSAEINGRIAMLRQSEADASLVIDEPPIISDAPTLTTEPLPPPVVEAPPEPPPVDLGGPVPLSPRGANPGDESSLSSEEQIRRALTGED